LSYGKNHPAAPLYFCFIINNKKQSKMANTQQFMLLFRFQPSDSYVPTAAEMEAQHQQWGAFIGNIAIQEKLVSTHQLGFEGRQITAAKAVSEGIYVACGETIAGNMIIKAASLDEAVELAKDCPILNVGGSVEVRSIMEM
jgi:hypothetical protein